jgi:hypothetical protein
MKKIREFVQENLKELCKEIGGLWTNGVLPPNPKLQDVDNLLVKEGFATDQFMAREFSVSMIKNEAVRAMSKDTQKEPAKFVFVLRYNDCDGYPSDRNTWDHMPSEGELRKALSAYYDEEVIEEIVWDLMRVGDEVYVPNSSSSEVLTLERIGV